MADSISSCIVCERSLSMWGLTLSRWVPNLLLVVERAPLDELEQVRERLDPSRDDEDSDQSLVDEPVRVAQQWPGEPQDGCP